MLKIKIKNQQTDVLENKIIIDGVECSPWSWLTISRSQGELWKIELCPPGGDDKLWKCGEVRFPDKIDGEWVGSITDAPTGYKITTLFAGWRDFYSESEADRIVNEGISVSYCYEFDKVILPRKLKSLSKNAFGKRRSGWDNEPELFISSDEDEGEVEIGLFIE